MGETLSALDVAKAANWFAVALAYPEENTPLADNAQHVERWLDEPDALLRARDKVDYTGLFDIGSPEPPAPLMESHYHQDKQARLRQVVTFYRTYGVINETEFSPDHLCVELSFLEFLASLAHDYPAREDLTNAYRVFSKVHLGSWIGAVISVVEKQSPGSIYKELLGGMGRFFSEVAAGLESLAEAEQVI